jgi:hypothetical protein
MTHSTDHPAPMSSPVYPPGRGAGGRVDARGPGSRGDGRGGRDLRGILGRGWPLRLRAGETTRPSPGAMEKGPPPDGA